MEINRKARGQKHHNNKARYQNKAKVVQKIKAHNEISDKNKDSSNKSTESERGLASNWHHYKVLSEDEDDELDEFTNFSLLAQAPISHGGHFQFKSDKNVESEFDFDSLRNSKLFSLDLRLLQTSLSTIPFHKRCGLDEDRFTESQLEEILQRSHQNTVQYESYLKINPITKESSMTSVHSKENDKCDELREIQHDIKTDSAADQQPIHQAVDIKELQISETTAESTNMPDVQTKVAGNKEELEEWLDDILND